MRQRLACTLLLLAACGTKSDGDATASATASTTATTSGTTTQVDLTDGAGSCPENAHVDTDGCTCDDGYGPCSVLDPADPNLCCPAAVTTGGDATTAPDATTSTTTTVITTTTGDSTTTVDTTTDGTTGTPSECAVPPPRKCDPNTEPFYCDQDEQCGPEGSTYFKCVNGSYVPDPDGPTASCKADGFDFSYGCVMTAEDVQFICDYGPGTPCESELILCADATTLNFCAFGKLGALDCVKQCQEVGDAMGVLHDTGYCAMTRMDTSCACCDKGEPGCPL